MEVRVTDGVGRAWLVRKRTEPEQPPPYLLGLEIPWWRFVGGIDPEGVQHDIESRLHQNDEIIALSPDGHGAALRRMFESTERSLLSSAARCIADGQLCRPCRKPDRQRGPSDRRGSVPISEMAIRCQFQNERRGRCDLAECVILQDARKQTPRQSRK